jgi:peptide deformylase
MAQQKMRFVTKSRRRVPQIRKIRAPSAIPSVRSDNIDMKLEILRYPDPRLHTVAKPVAAVDDRIRQLVADMTETMYDAQGVGLAATQVNVHEQVIVIDTSEERNQPMVLINPRIVAASAEHKAWDEGCLSVPGIYDKVDRPAAVRVAALDEHGTAREIEADELLAVAIQHEMDHLAGKVFVEYLSPLKRNRIKSKMLKQTREEERELEREAAQQRRA